MVIILRSPRIKFRKKLTIIEKTKLQRKPKSADKSGNFNENRKNATINEGKTKNKKRTAILPIFFANI